MAVVPPILARAALGVSVLLAFGLLRWLDRTRDWGQYRRARLVLGVPWGTLIAIAGVLSVYLFVQGGLANWYDPITIPYRSWSYFYPLGTFVSGFAHNSAGHLIGNLVGTLVFGSVAEYAWGHFPRERGRTVGEDWRRNPFVRAGVVFPAVVFGLGIVTGVFGLGPTIGFSGVVFALAGFALTRYPIGTALGLLVTEGIGLGYRALRKPELTAEAGPRFITPGWANVSIQGHLLGLLAGVAIGLLVFRAFRKQQNPVRLCAGVILFAIHQNLWALWWFRGNGEFVLFRALGLVFAIWLSVLVVGALLASDRPVPRWITDRRVAATAFVLALGGLGGSIVAGLTAPAIGIGPASVPVVPGGLAAIALVVGLLAVRSGDDPLVPNRSRREVAAVAILMPLLFTALIAVPTNLTTVDDASSPGETTVSVRDYKITYAENVTNELVSVVNVSVLGETTAVRTSGVIVISESRGIWTTAISSSRLSFAGQKTTRVGGLGWRASVDARRVGWSVASGPAAYRVFLRRGDMRRWRPAFTSERAVSDHRLAGAAVAIVPSSAGFSIELRDNDTTLASAPIPDRGENATIRGIQFDRETDRVIARYNGTRIQVASKQSE